MQSAQDFVIKVEKTAEKTGLYKQGAYFFVFSALEYTVKKLPERRHITGRELLEGIAEYARNQYGPLAKSVFKSWGITRTIDFGKIVFDLVDSKLMGKTAEDKLEDFEGVYDFNSEFNWSQTSRGLHFPERFR